MCRLNETAHTGGITGHKSHGDGVTDGGDIGVIHGFVGLGFDHHTDVFVIVQHHLQSICDALSGDHRVFGFTDIGTFTGKPQHDVTGPQSIGDIDGAFGAFQSIFPAFGAVVGVSAVDGLGGEPHTGSHKLSGQTVIVQDLLQFSGFFDDLIGSQICHVGHSIIIVELDTVKAHLLVGLQLLVEGDGVADFRTERVSSFVDVPRTERKTECSLHDFNSFVLF